MFCKWELMNETGCLVSSVGWFRYFIKYLGLDSCPAQYLLSLWGAGPITFRNWHNTGAKSVFKENYGHLIFKFLRPFWSCMLTTRGRTPVGSDWVYVNNTKLSQNSFWVERKVGGPFQWWVCLFSGMGSMRWGHGILPPHLRWKR